MQLREVGIELELEEADLVAAVLPKMRERKANQYIRAGIPSKKAVEPQISLFNAGKGTGRWFESDEIYKMWEDLLQMSDPEAADAQLRKIGNYKFENFEIIPLFDVYIEVVVNPKIIQDWPFSGWDGGDVGHTYLIWPVSRRSRVSNVVTNSSGHCERRLAAPGQLEHAPNASTYSVQRLKQ